MKQVSQPYVLFTSVLSSLPDGIADRICYQLDKAIHYAPVIGLMGKSGAGKSSLCNTLFSPPPARVDAVNGCTRCVQRYQVSYKSHTLSLIDFPGMGETPGLDKIYSRLYQEWAEKLDLIIWVLKADDRAWNEDIQCYRKLLQAGADPTRFLFVLSQADKIEPCREWKNNRPSERQYKNLMLKTERVESTFKPVHPVVAVSASEGYNLHQWVETFIMALPARASGAVVGRLGTVYRTEKVIGSARERFADAVGDIFDETIGNILTSQAFSTVLLTVRERLISLAKSLWHIFF
ncbi:GTPase family protein [Pectobacterium versatile]|uniref:GTPase family protein n=1 Tax=Pectobacterium versatile TaxID=2488639 RepID=UPI001F26201D|nr:GTPase [Pectobacterium versatile]